MSARKSNRGIPFLVILVTNATTATKSAFDGDA